jgi:hypothetical protein
LRWSELDQVEGRRSQPTGALLESKSVPGNPQVDVKRAV